MEPGQKDNVAALCSCPISKVSSYTMHPMEASFSRVSPPCVCNWDGELRLGNGMVVQHNWRRKDHHRICSIFQGEREASIPPSSVLSIIHSFAGIQKNSSHSWGALSRWICAWGSRVRVCVCRECTSFLFLHNKSASLTQSVFTTCFLGSGVFFICLFLFSRVFIQLKSKCSVTALSSVFRCLFWGHMTVTEFSSLSLSPSSLSLSLCLLTPTAQGLSGLTC